jgi:hypothetical protein
MLHAGLDLSRKKVDVCLLSDEYADERDHGQSPEVPVATKKPPQIATTIATGA